MRTIGLIGGMSYHSTLLYYRHINAHIQRKLGSPTSASLILHSFNYADINPLFTSRRWSELAAHFIRAGKHLKTTTRRQLFWVPMSHTASRPKSKQLSTSHCCTLPMQQPENCLQLASRR